jgi:hypothetical protein
LFEELPPLLGIWLVPGSHVDVDDFRCTLAAARLVVQPHLFASNHAPSSTWEDLRLGREPIGDAALELCHLVDTRVSVRVL